MYLASIVCATPPVKGMNCKTLWLYRVPSSIVWCSWVIKKGNLSFTGIASLYGKILQILLSPVVLVSETYFLLELFCRTLKDTWLISEYFLWVVSYKVNGATTRRVTFFPPTLHCVYCSLFLSLWFYLPYKIYVLKLNSAASVLCSTETCVTYHFNS